MNDFELMAEVWDGGIGDHPKLLEACQAWTRQWNAEMDKRSSGLDPADWALERARVDAFLKERMRVARGANLRL